MKFIRQRRIPALSDNMVEAGIPMMLHEEAAILFVFRITETTEPFSRNWNSVTIF